MKKVLFFMSIIVFLSITYKLYTEKKTEIKEDNISKAEQTSTAQENTKPYNRVKSDWPEGDIFGNIVEISDSAVTIEEVISLKCFFSVDYAGGEYSLSPQEIDAKYNTEYLPWCTDPSGGTYYEKTGNKMAFNFDPQVKFSITIYDENAHSGGVDKNTFIQKAKESKMMVALTLKNNSVIKVDEVYND